MSTGKMITEKTVKVKVVIPTKSRIAAWWMLITGGVAVATCLALFISAWLTPDTNDPDMAMLAIGFWGAGGIAAFFFYFLPGLIILMRGWGDWMIASGILSIAVAFSFFLLIYTFYSLIPVIAFLVPLILILSDHISYKRGGTQNENHMS
jgi:hypothetical protein